MDTFHYSSDICITNHCSVCVCACVRVRVRVCVRVCAHACVHVLMYAFVCAALWEKIVSYSQP